MERDQAIARLKEHEAELRQLGIEHLYLFGSTARRGPRSFSTLTCFSIIPSALLGFTS
jgi:hypothetical protein